MMWILHHLVLCPYCNGNALRVRRGSFSIWSNSKTLKPLNPQQTEDLSPKTPNRKGYICLPRGKAAEPEAGTFSTWARRCSRAFEMAEWLRRSLAGIPTLCSITYGVMFVCYAMLIIKLINK